MYSMVIQAVLRLAIVAGTFELIACSTPTATPTSIDYESFYQNAFSVPTSPQYNSVIGTTTGITLSAYEDDSRRRLEEENHSGLRGESLLSSMKNLLGESPSPAYRGWSGTLHRNVPHPAAGPPGGGGGGGGPPGGGGGGGGPPGGGGGGSGGNAGGGPPPQGGGSGGTKDAPTVSSGWKIEFTGVPEYDHTMTQEDIDTLNNRPRASSDFPTGQTTASVGDVVTFAENIGYSTSKCEYGYWPPGPVCPDAYSGSWLFSLAPAPETNSGGCYIGNTLGFLVNGVPFWSWTDGHTYNDAGVWNQLAGEFEQIYDMDICGGHSAQGTYHHHAYPNCLADILNDDGTGHSPIYGFAYDSYPLYGPYQGNDLMAVSCWQKRNYASSSPTGCSNSQRSCQLVDQYDYTKGTKTVASGPNTGGTVETSSSNTISSDSGIYFEDFFFNATCAELGSNYLDSFNGHSHGSLGYHYHITVDSDMTPTFPYTLGPKFYGCIRYGTCNLGYQFDNTETSDSTCGTSDSSSPVPGKAASSGTANKKKLPPGAIVGIVIGALAVLIFIICITYYSCCRGSSNSRSGGSSYSVANHKEVDMVPVTTTGPTNVSV